MLPFRSLHFSNDDDDDDDDVDEREVGSHCEMDKDDDAERNEYGDHDDDNRCWGSKQERRYSEQHRPHDLTVLRITCKRR